MTETSDPTPKVLLGWVGEAENSLQNNGKKLTPLNEQQEFSKTSEPPPPTQRHLPFPGLASALAETSPYLLHSSTKVSRSSLLGFFCLS